MAGSASAPAISLTASPVRRYRRGRTRTRHPAPGCSGVHLAGRVPDRLRRTSEPPRRAVERSRSGAAAIDHDDLLVAVERVQRGSVRAMVSFLVQRGDDDARHERNGYHHSEALAMPEDIVETTLSGIDLINDPMLNKGTAFTEAERTLFALHGLLPPHDRLHRGPGLAAAESPARLRDGLSAVRLPARPAGHQRDAVLRCPGDTTSKSCCRWSTRRPSARAASASARSGASRAACS